MTEAPRIVWEPNKPIQGALYSSQELFLRCPAFEGLLEGGRGGGKTTVLLADFAQEIGQGFGPHWRGVLFRQTYKQLDDVVQKSLLLFRQTFPDAKWNAGDYVWTWPTGERLLFRYMDKEADYWNYHGWEIPWLGWEELTNWPDLSCYDRMLTCCRSSFVGLPRRVRGTTNPWGPGHSAVHKRFIAPAPSGVPILNPKTKQHRVRIYCPLEENRAVLEASPEYQALLSDIEDENLRKAWEGKEDRWNISAGAYFADVWSSRHHAIAPFEIPKHWRLRRGFDWGFDSPSALVCGAIAAEDYDLPDGRTMKRGSLVIFAEWYPLAKDKNGEETYNKGPRMQNEDQGEAIALFCKGKNFSGCVADTQIFAEPGQTSIYQQLQEGAKRQKYSLNFGKADKTRVAGWLAVRSMLAAAKKVPTEEPGLYIFRTCRHLIRTIVAVQRDEANPNDLNTKQEDHLLDALRYKVNSLAQPQGRTQRDTGL